jgi:four helix bundle protein
VSIAANIVEGFRKRGAADKIRFLNIAQASADECLYFLVLIHDLRFLETDSLQLQLEEVLRLLHSYSSAIER